VMSERMEWSMFIGSFGGSTTDAATAEIETIRTAGRAKAKR